MHDEDYNNEFFSPIFVVGNSRSGTTLMSSIMGNNSSIFTFNELHFFEELWDPSSSTETVSLDQVTQLTAKLINIQRNGYLTQGKTSDHIQEAQKLSGLCSGSSSPSIVFRNFLLYESQLHGKSRPCEQTPLNILYLDEILRWYPNARIIIMIRDPRDILLSQKRRWRRSFLAKSVPKKQAVRYWMNYHAFTISKLWNTNAIAAERFRDDDRVYHLKFENLLSEPEDSVQSVCEFVGIPFEKGLLEVPQINSSSVPDNPECIGINQGRIGAWRESGVSSTEISICQQVNRDMMDIYGYKLEVVHPNIILLIFSYFSLPVKLFLSLMFNLKRMSNFKTAIRRRFLIRKVL